jgi:hypothetical protein
VFLAVTLVVVGDDSRRRAPLWCATDLSDAEFGQDEQASRRGEEDLGGLEHESVVRMRFVGRASSTS